jgi:cytochrome c oxidase subunit III
LSDRAPAIATHSPVLEHHFSSMEQQLEASVMGMWVFLITEIMFFGGMFCGYMVYRYQYYGAWVAGSQKMDFWWGTLNTALLLCSSLTMAMAVRSAQLGRRKAIVIFLLVTILFGLGFLAIKGIEYHGHWTEHQFPGLNWAWPETNSHLVALFFSFYWAMTGFHALHMVIGVGLVSWIAYHAWKGLYNREYYAPVEVVGLYWHFVDIIWIYLYPLLYLISHKHSSG